MRIVIKGRGGREAAMALAFDRFGHEVMVTPGGAGILGWDSKSPAKPPEELDADLFVIGPEQPLVDGLADRLRAQGKAVFGPGADGARLEGSKAFMKEVLIAAGVPTAKHEVCTHLKQARYFMEQLERPGYVVKTDGLAAGKGVFVTNDLWEALTDAEAKLSGQAFGDAGKVLVVEEKLVTPGSPVLRELSLHVVCDGTKVVILPVAQDYKHLLDGDLGPNTGGMGAYCPVLVEPELLHQANDRIIIPLMAELHRRGIDLRCVLFLGLGVTADGPVVLEINVRFGDPETQVIFPLFASDPAQLLLQAAEGNILEPPRFTDQAAVAVVLAAKGYPDDPRKGDVISGLGGLTQATDALALFAGVAAQEGHDEPYTDGGRVMNIVDTGPTVARARERVYNAVGWIKWDGMQYRTDIAAGV